MRQYVYTCCRCGREERTPAESDDPPTDWARVTYERAHRLSDQQSAITTLTTHACADCAATTLAFLEKVTHSNDIDRAFDDGGAA